MNRRHAMLGLAAAGAAMPLLRGTAIAQTAPLVTPGTVRTVSETEHKAMTLMGGTLAKQTSQLALERSQNLKVKQFATFEIAEQTAVAQVLTDTGNPPPVGLDSEHQAMLTSLQSLSGAEFDRAYVQNQIVGHKELLLVQQGYLDNTNRSVDGQHIAVLARMSIQQHITMLEELNMMLQRT
jgi:putative membrane protein